AEVRALREHLAAMATAGAAILISSHLLAEVELLASHVVLLDDGAVRASGRLDELTAGAEERLEDVFMQMTRSGDVAR
ncbi:MAG: hypothetical protein ABI355_15690, partial [Solirubrobacteraceae bacterium]